MQSKRLSDPQDFDVFRSVLYYCVAIISLPVLSFFSSKYFLDTVGVAAVTANVYAAIFAVLMLHVALGLYLYKAYSTTAPEGPPKIIKED